MKRFLILLFNLSWVSCSVIPNPKIKLGYENVEHGSFSLNETNRLDTLFSDTLTAYLKLHDSVWAKNCSEDHKCHFSSVWKFKRDANKTLFLECICDKQPYEPIPIMDTGPYWHGDSICYDRFFNVLYYSSSTAFFIGDIADLKNESKRYALKSFLSKNNMKLPNTEMAFVYLYHTYSNLYFSACGSPYFYPITNFKQIPLPLVERHDHLPEFSIIRTDYDLFQAQMEWVLQKYQPESEHYFCGAITGRNRNEGKWELYFFVVDERNPMDYEIYVFQTPKRKRYTWTGFGA